MFDVRLVRKGSIVVLDFSSLLDVIISLIFMLFIIYSMVVEVRLFHERGRAYLRLFWSYVQWGIIVSSWIALSIYVWRYNELKQVGRVFREQHGYVYMNLEWATHVNDVLMFVLGFCCFFATIKLLRFSRYTHHLSLYGDVIKQASRELVLCMVVFLIIVFAFINLFYLLFSSKLWSCSSVMKTSEMVFEMILLKVNSVELLSMESVLGPVCVSMFVLFVVLVGMTMFISVIGRSFGMVRKKDGLRENEDREMLGYMVDRGLRWLGMFLAWKSE